MMEKFEVGSKEVDEHVRNLMQSIVGRQLAQRKAGEDVSSQLSNDKNGEDTYQYDSVSVASSLWSLEAQASVKNMRVSQNNLPNNNSIDENDAGDNVSEDIDLNISTTASPYNTGSSMDADLNSLPDTTRSDGSSNIHSNDGRNNHDKALQTLNQCVSKLGEVDLILNEFTIFWGKMENAMTSIIQKNTHVESMLNFTHNQKLRDRFFLRLDEYASLWREIGAVCGTYVLNEKEVADSTAKLHNTTIINNLRNVALLD